jgi:CHAD domain-containing protein
MIQIDKWISGISPDHRLTDVARRLLRSRLEAVQHCLQLVAEHDDEDLERVHQLRVWTRRADTAMKLFAGFLPRHRAAWVKKRLKRLRRAANEARDLDVLVQRLTTECSVSKARRSIETFLAQRAAARAPVIALYERLKQDDRFDRRIRKLLKRVRPRGRGSAKLEDRLFGDWAREGLQSIVEDFFGAAPSRGADLSALHKFRIRGKRLRYAMELLAGAFPSDFRDKLYAVVEMLQDKLGKINDLATAQVRLRAEIEEAGEPADANELRRLHASESARLEQAQREFLDWCTPDFLRAFRAEFDRILGRPTKAGIATDWVSFTAQSDSLWEALAPSKARTDPLASDLAGKTRIVDEFDEKVSLLPSPVTATGV